MTLKLSILSSLRRATNTSILLSPSIITLVPHLKVNKGGGVWKVEAQTPRAPQTFLVEPSGNAIVDTEGAQAHSWSYNITGRYDCQMAINDQWKHGDTTYTIVSIQPDNGYEKVGAVTALGKDPAYG